MADLGELNCFRYIWLVVRGREIIRFITTLALINSKLNAEHCVRMNSIINLSLYCRKTALLQEENGIGKVGEYLHNTGHCWLVYFVEVLSYYYSLSPPSCGDVVLPLIATKIIVSVMNHFLNCY